ncbi:MAG: calcium-binding protein [Mycobacterium sp.]
MRTPPTLLDDVGANLHASVIALDSGGFAIAYEDTGWGTTGDADITLAFLDAMGTGAGWVDISQNDDDDTLPSTTLLSNGLIVVGSTSAEFGLDPTWTLVDPENGDRLASTGIGQTLNSDTDTSLAGMLDGQVAAFFTNVNTADIVGQVLQVRRITNGDTYANDFIVGDELVDFVFGGGGDDTIRGGGNADNLAGSSGNDTFVFLVGDMVGDTINGDEDFDCILLAGTSNLGTATIAGIEEIEFESPSPYAVTATLGAAQVGAGLALNLVIDGTTPAPEDPTNPGAVDPGDTLRVIMGDTATVDLSGFVFFDFNTSATGLDRVQIWGDDDAEIIVGSAQADTVLAAGGNDVLTGGGGIDTLRGGLGDDTYIVNAAGEAKEAADEGLDTVKSRVTYTLGANIENLALLGTGDTDGTGNDLKNKLTGNDGANALDGGAGIDVLAGGKGNDTLTGGADRDRFDFNAKVDSAPGLSDVIADFAGNGALVGDLVDLSTIDANELVGGDQAFVFIGTAAFTAAGQVRYAGGVLLASTDGDVQAEVRIVLTGNPPLLAADLVL